ncbi:hypothetical protein R3Q06_33540 [Rhodococcus erythropolis]|uniref:hypothetical protein n=1 Tax=Rhodococcus erythropolis TaxID=1833 RepID=UPI002949E18D|nr:hypothetical protein [Rhodococcus erythropolis]MDV6278361.1 hypothetical protein [Rhodococcus erythropolis]
MTAHHTTRIRMASLRKLLSTPLAVGILAGGVCAGTGLGTAAPVPDAITESTCAPDTPPAAAGDLNWWFLYNFTGQPIYGEWSEQSGSAVSEVKRVKEVPLPDRGFESRGRNDCGAWNPYWMGHICSNHAWWNLPRDVRRLSHDAAFTLQLVNGSLKATWNPSDSRAPFEAFLTRNWAEGSC